MYCVFSTCYRLKTTYIIFANPYQYLNSGEDEDFSFTPNTYNIMTLILFSF